MNKNEILIGLSESRATGFGKAAFESQTAPQRVFSTVWTVESEVNNGGFSQYFLNAGAETAGFVVEAFTAIGAPQTAGICRRAVECAFPDGLPPTADEISSLAAEFTEETLEQLEAFDTEFFAYPHDLTELLFAYVSARPEEFGTLPEPG